MDTKHTLICSSLFYLSMFFISTELKADNQSASDLKTTVDFSQGYRREKLNLKLKSKEAAGTIHTKTHFDDIDVYSSRLGITFTKHDYFLKTVLGYGYVYDGKFSTPSVTKNGTSTERFNMNSDVTGSYTADIALTVGKNFSCGNGWIIAPTIGYGVYMQDFHTNHGKMHYDDNGHKKHLKGLKHKLKTTWFTPQIGINIKKAITSTLSAHVDYALLYPLNYRATGYYNTMFKGSRYQQNNKPYKSFGNIATLGLEWNFAPNWSLKPEIELMKFYSKGGDSSHRFDLQSVNRTATEFRIGLGYQF